MTDDDRDLLPILAMVGLTILAVLIAIPFLVIAGGAS